MSISQGRATTPAPVSSRYRKPSTTDFRPQPGRRRGLCLEPRLAAAPLEGTGRVFAHGIAIGRLVGVKHTAAAAVSPCTKIATVAHAGLAQSFLERPVYTRAALDRRQ